MSEDAGTALSGTRTPVPGPSISGSAGGRGVAGDSRRAARPVRRRAGRAALWLSVGWAAVLVFTAVFANLLPIRAYDVPVSGLGPAALPGLHEPLGTDALGRSVLSRLIFGGRESLLVGGVSVCVAMAVGLILGMAAGYLRGPADALLGVLLDTLLSIPPLVLLLTIAAFADRTVWTVIAGLSVVGVPTFARLARAHTLTLAQREYVVAARAMGATRLRVVARELLPGVVITLSPYAFMFFAIVIVAEGSLSFLGLGVPPPSPSWGGMVNDGRTYLATRPLLVFVPAACLALTVLSFTTIGDRVRRRFDPAADPRLATKLDLAYDLKEAGDP